MYSTPFGIRDSCTITRWDWARNLVFKCSTPFGINDSCTLRPVLPRREPLPVLNAFRHQRFLHTSSTTRRSTTRVLNALLVGLALNDLLDVCSTPFGINDSCTGLRPGDLAAFVGLCSTPFGIIDSCTLGCRRLGSRASTCAQRLSASSIPAPGDAFVDRGLLPMCSTPFGIIDSCTVVGQPGRPERHGVLNAFRHHRFLHSASGTPAPHRRSAQRLSASSIPAPTGSSGRAATCRGAQRLSASSIPAPCIDSEHIAIPVVMCSTPFGIIDSCTCRVGPDFSAAFRVLNAFRHHRFLHWDELLEAADRLYLCSTPFGIIDSCTQSAGRDRPARRELCSTPFGIIDSCTSPSGGSRASSCLGAQRLSASSIPALIKSHPSLSISISAQRLSASSIPAPSYSISKAANLLRCSTPFGIIDSCTRLGDGLV